MPIYNHRVELLRLQTLSQFSNYYKFMSICNQINSICLQTPSQFSNIKQPMPINNNYIRRLHTIAIHKYFITNTN